MVDVVGMGLGGEGRVVCARGSPPQLSHVRQLERGGVARRGGGGGGPQILKGSG